MLISIGLIISLLIPKAYASVRYFHSDHLGSSSVLTDDQGNISGETQYFPYGETFQDTAAEQSPYKYTGQESDTETDLYYYRARYYDPILARFLSTDPVNENLESYCYVNNNPIKYVDPTGELEEIPHTSVPAWIGEGSYNSVFFSDFSGLKTINDNLSMDAGNLAISKMRDHVEYLEVKYGVEAVRPPDSDEVYWKGKKGDLAKVQKELPDKLFHKSEIRRVNKTKVAQIYSEISVKKDPYPQMTEVSKKFNKAALEKAGKQRPLQALKTLKNYADDSKMRRRVVHDRLAAKSKGGGGGTTLGVLGWIPSAIGAFSIQKDFRGVYGRDPTLTELLGYTVTGTRPGFGKDDPVTGTRVD